jgi:hypothetical protein
MRQKLHRVRDEAKKRMGRICCERMAVLNGFCCEPYPGGQFIGRPPST